MVKKIIACMCAFAFVFMLCSCEEYYDEINYEFGKFKRDEGIAVFENDICYKIHFSDGTIDLTKYDFKGDLKGASFPAVTSNNGKIYVATCGKALNDKYGVYIYEYDRIKNSFNLIFEKEDHIDMIAYGNDNYFYITPYNEDFTKELEMYNLDTFLLEKIAYSGGNAIDYVKAIEKKREQETLECIEKNKVFEINYIEKNVKFRIDEEYLQRYECTKVLLQFDYYAISVAFRDGRIFLSYGLSANTLYGDLFLVVFELNPDSGEITFKIILNPDTDEVIYTHVLLLSTDNNSL